MMTPLERRASASLASIYALRMLGLFLVLPVFALEARHYPGGDNPALIGLAMGIYGLTQGLLQLPFGMASDRLGPQAGHRVRPGCCSPPAACWPSSPAA
jgi:MFS family permease